MTATAVVGFGQVQRVTVHFDDLDAIGIVHNAKYAVLVERALSAYWSARGHSFQDGQPTTSDVVHAVREFSITYHAPIRGTGDLDVHFWVERLGESSAVYRFRFLSPNRATVYAEGRRVVVKLDLATGRPAPWTPHGREVAAALLRDPG
ncbi:MAG TPA: thioesterase family protein [Micromonosporaceae bacterium]|nr:thioesterase family protein [Micromonosporaceae bacterium]